MNDVSRSAGRSFVEETVARFERDRGRVVAELLSGRDPGPLVTVEPEAGDRHQGGRSVAMLRFADSDEPVVYKPRSVQTAELYASLLTWLDARCPGLAPAAVPTMVRGGYGWSRFVRPEPCRDVAGVRRFYRRQGAVLALLHATDATDMHAENVIASGDHPLLIDTETLLHPLLERTVLTGADPAVRAHENSVLRTLLLPTLMRGGPAAVDVSGLGGGSAAAPNRPTLDGAAPDPAEYLSDLLGGFRQAYDAISIDADSFCRELEGARRIMTRFVARATRRYGEFLKTGTEADLEPAGFEGAELLLEHERRDLAAGDVPIFFARPGSRALWSSRGERIDGVLAASGLESAIAKVRAMDADERRRQEWMIEAAFATRAGTVRHRCAVTGSAGSAGSAATGPDPGALDPQWAVDQAVGIARELSALACRDGDRLNWLGLEPLEDGHWTVLPTGLGLSHGYGGVALFLAQLGAVTGRSEFTELAAQTLAVAPALVAALAELPGHLGAIGGGFDGMGGVAYVLRRAGVLLDSAELRQAAEVAEELAARAGDGAQPVVAAAPDSADVAHQVDDSWCHGLAGQAAAGRLDQSQLTEWLARLGSAPILDDLTVCHGEFGVLEALTLLAADDDRAGTVLRRRAAQLPDAVARGATFSGAPGATPTPGFFHGLAGVGYGLLRVASPEAVPSVLTLQSSP